MIRAFVAVAPDAPLREALAKIQAALRGRLEQAAGPGARIQWVRPESIHLTLKFLGDVPEERVAEIGAALDGAAAGHARFTLEADGLGVFPDLRAPRVLWAGLADPAGAARRLADGVDAALDAIGFAPERKPFHPHLTLARVKERSREVGLALARERWLEQPAMQGPLTVAAVALMKSELKPSGAVYTELRRAALKEA
jgi:2'-5' RNA ligase